MQCWLFIYDTPSSSSAGTHTLSTIPALAGSDICIPLLPRHSIIITVSFQTFCTRKEMKYKFMKLSEHFKILFPRGWGGCQYVFAHYKNGRFLARQPITFFLMWHVLLYHANVAFKIQNCDSL